MFARYLPPEYSGAASQALLLAQELRKRGHHTEFVSPSWKGQPWSYNVDGFQVTGVRINLDAVHKEFSIWRALSAYLWQRRHEIDILHGQGAYYTQSIVGPLGRLFGKPSLVKASLANDDLSSLSGSSISAIHRRFLDMIDAYVAISSDLEREFLDKGLRGERIRRIPNGVDTERFRPASPQEKAAAAQALGLPTDRHIALFVGVFDQRKRIAWLAERWAATGGFGTGSLLVAVGPTSREPYGESLRKELEDLAAAHPDLLRICGHAEDIAPFYRAAHCFVFPSSNEGLPNALLEAMACGLPAVCTRVSGSNELVVEDVTGATFEVDDAQGLAQALARVQQADAAVMGERARALIEQRFGIARIASLYEELYESLMAGRRHRGGIR
jgi:glycosyltransferase involved in cell wall biosynthesis